MSGRFPALPIDLIDLSISNLEVFYSRIAEVSYSQNSNRTLSDVQKNFGFAGATESGVWSGVNTDSKVKQAQELFLD